MRPHEFKYENPNHLFFVCRKILFKNGIKLDYEDQVGLKGICEKVFFFQEKYEDLIRQLELRELTRIFTYKLFQSYDADSLRDNLESFVEVFRRYQQIVKEETPDRNEYRDLYDEYYKPIIIKEKLWSSADKRYKHLAKKFLEKQKEIEKKHGVYFLYDHDKQLIYIGKSVHDLWGRIISSAKERNAVYYSYALTKTKSDTSVYEMYYISKYKPKLNNDGKYNDEVTISLPDLEFTELQFVYQEDEEEFENGQVQTNTR